MMVFVVVDFFILQIILKSLDTFLILFCPENKDTERWFIRMLCLYNRMASEIGVWFLCLSVRQKLHNCTLSKLTLKNSLKSPKV